MTKNFKLDVIVYSDSGAIGFYWPVPLKNKYCPFVAFVCKEQPSNKMLQEFNSKNSCWVIEDEKFIDGIMKHNIEKAGYPNEYIKEIAELYALIKYNRDEKLKDTIEFKKLPEILSSDFLYQVAYCYLGIYTDENLGDENGPTIFNLASEMACRNYGAGTYLLALCYLYGFGIKKSKEKFIKYLNKACDLGDKGAKETKRDINKYLDTF